MSTHDPDLPRHELVVAEAEQFALASLSVRELFKPMLIGESALCVEGLWQEMYQDSLLHCGAGSVMRALSMPALIPRSARSPGRQHD